MNFIERNTKKVALILCLITAGSCVTSVYAMENSQGWHGHDFEKYYLQSNGERAIGWLVLEDGTYYLNNEGNLFHGWLTLNEKTYYINYEGKKVRNTQVIDGHQYNFMDNGELSRGWNHDQTMYYDTYGYPVSGLQTIDRMLYHFDDKGSVQDGWFAVNGKQRYFTPKGQLASGVLKVDGKKIQFNNDGTVTTGWQKVKSKTYYYDNAGFKTTGWKTIKGKKYYFDKDGSMKLDTKYEGYKFDKNGVATKIEEKKKEAEQKLEGATTSRPQDLNPSGSSSNTSAVSVALAQNNDRYVFGGQAPGGFDCSGLMYYAYGQVGVQLPRTAGGQASVGSEVSYKNMQAGDLIVWNYGEHVSMYIGGGSMIHATNPVTGVVIDNVSWYLSHSPQFITAIRRP